MRAQTLTDQEYAAFLSAIDKTTPRDGLIIRFMLQCGLRAGEVCALNIENVWREGHIHPALYLPKGTTKSHQARHVDMPAPVRAALEPYIAVLQVKGFPTAPGTPLFFALRRHGRLVPRDIERITAALALAAIGRAINPHMLRHTFATILIRHTNIEVCRQLLGHASIATTQIYLHPSSQDCKVAMDAAFGR